jgi:hypothetical protein
VRSGIPVPQHRNLHRPGLGEHGLGPVPGEEVAPVLVPLLEDPLSLHRLVQAVSADQMPAELARQWRQAATALIDAAIPEDTELLQGRVSWRTTSLTLSAEMGRSAGIPALRLHPDRGTECLG